MYLNNCGKPVKLKKTVKKFVVVELSQLSIKIKLIR